ncbi:MAG: hypothetical protein JST75_09310 [Bacteroidetes bacterium]|nr:hypothetical protein [Bacteroidota bacterium]
MPSFYIEHAGQEWRVIFGYRDGRYSMDEPVLQIFIDYLNQGNMNFDGERWIFNSDQNKELDQELADKIGEYIQIYYE